MPGIKTLLKGWNETNGKEKLGTLLTRIDNIIAGLPALKRTMSDQAGAYKSTV